MSTTVPTRERRAPHDRSPLGPAGPAASDGRGGGSGLGSGGGSGGGSDSAAGPAVGRGGVGEGVLTLALGVLLLTALIPLQRVFIGSEWIRPVVGGVVLALAIGWGARRLDVGPLTHLAMSAASLLVFCTIAFAPGTGLLGAIPTASTLAALRDLGIRGLELVELRPSPTFAEAGLLLLAVSGTWLMAFLADGMQFVLRAPLKAVVTALVLWAVPLAVAPEGTDPALPALSILAASALLLLLSRAREVGEFGRRIGPGEGRVRMADALPPVGLALTAVAALAGLVVAQLLPGYDAAPLVEARGGTGTTITTNPIVDIKQRLVAGDGGPIAFVDSPARPVYLRTTSLDTYDADEQWTSGTISGQPVQGVVDTPPRVALERVDVGVQIGAAIERGAVLAPAPYQPIEVSGGRAEELRYDRRSATLTAPGDEPLVPGDGYAVAAAIPQPSAEALRSVVSPGGGAAYTQLPDNVPAEVVALAQQIVDEAGATTMFDRALAVQDRLRSWSYSTTPEPGLGATALLRFIDAQEGYCEQFAGTMAVMLRTLGIPARLAVGYTPGDLLPDGRWEVTNANAHAWVEVDFGPYGWVPFEPTPRTDGNVLVTSASAVVPSRTVAQEQGLVADPADPVGPGGLADLRPSADPQVPEEDPLAVDPVGGGGAAAEDGGRWPLVALLLAAVGVGVALVVRRGRAGPVGASPAERITAARERVQRVGRAVGRARHPAETDEEYLTRIADGHRAGGVLAVPATRAVYAPAVTAEEAEAAEHAADQLVARLTDPLPWWRRQVVEVRAALGR